MKSLICDNQGIPLLIQKMRYNYGSMIFEVTFFNGNRKDFPEEIVGSIMGLLQKTPTRMQELQILNNIEKLALKEWKNWWDYEEEVA